MIITTSFPGLVAVYCLQDIFTIIVAQLDFYRIPVTYKSAEDTSKEILSTNANAIEKMQPIVVESSKQGCYGHIQLYLGG